MQTLAGNILIVDDEAFNRDLLLRQLEKEGYTVTLATGGQEAIDIMTIEQFDLVLLDIMMPEVSGYDVLAFITSEPHIKDHTSVIIISAEMDREAMIKCMRMGAEDYLTKPFQMQIIKSRVWSSIYNRRNIPEHIKYSDEITDAHILLVDDQEMNLEVISRRLEQLGYKVSCVDNGKDALTMLNDVSYDLVLLDIMMPEMNGYDVLDSIRNTTSLVNVPKIMISALDDMDSVNKCIEKGATDYLVKPVNGLLLKRRIEASLETPNSKITNAVVL